ncbi:MAG: sodium:calcium antiporter, partial [Lachnospiraceae bacterium]|nr:sodium:calcium antiporter [Lachnospiraceae bacterium]
AQAAAAGNSGISYGNAIGSVICNTSLIAAITMAVRPAPIKKQSLFLPVGYFFCAAIVYSVFAYAVGTFPRWFGLILLAAFIVYLVISTIQMKKHPEEAEEEEEEEEGKEKKLWQELLLLVIGAAAIALGAKFLVDNGTILAEAMGVPSSVIGLTVIALGTSLPELITAITSLVKGHSALSLGNVIGANLFNIILVSGAAITISPFAVPAEKTIMGLNSSLIIDIPLMFAVMLIMCVPSLVKGKVSRWQGILLLAIYAAFNIYQFLL